MNPLQYITWMEAPELTSSVVHYILGGSAEPLRTGRDLRKFRFYIRGKVWTGEYTTVWELRYSLPSWRVDVCNTGVSANNRYTRLEGDRSTPWNGYVWVGNGGGCSFNFGFVRGIRSFFANKMEQARPLICPAIGKSTLTPKSVNTPTQTIVVLRYDMEPAPCLAEPAPRSSVVLIYVFGCETPSWSLRENARSSFTNKELTVDYPMQTSESKRSTRSTSPRSGTTGKTMESVDISQSNSAY
ncbi:hypothetical protein EDB83DRAFT_2557085 [Lactarius deliciosus]|nr:hypothetical protein EDB83DRAFT_2557085 [Lactarius deliciosus]